MAVPRINLEFHPAPNPTRTGVLVLPGGSYEFLSMEKEGLAPAKWLNDRDIDVWILSYTCATTAPPPIYPAPQREALAAVQQIRESKKVDTLGIWGFSAGGHLAAVTATSEGVDLDFAILAYPVISMAKGTTHEGSRRNLIGDHAEAGGDVEEAMCAEKRVGRTTPPVFLFHTANDDAVPVQNSLGFAAAMAKHGRPFGIFILPNGPHGIGLALGDEKLSWTGELERWLKGFIKS